MHEVMVLARRAGVPAWLAVALAALLVVAAGAARAQPVDVTPAAACTASERTLWWCEAGHRRYALCASADFGADSGYLQWRARQAGRPALAIPRAQRQPRGQVEMTLLARGVRVEIHDGSRGIAIDEPLDGPTTVEFLHAGKASATLECERSSDSLTLTEVQDLFRRAGLLH